LSPDASKPNSLSGKRTECGKGWICSAANNYGGGSKDYLSWSLLGLLMQEGKLKRDDTVGKHVAQVR
jgi:hypothetical protein